MDKIFFLWLLSLCFARQPNFILMFADDMGYGDLGFTGHPTSETPNIDKLAATGAIMTSWYTGGSVCTASRASMLTGRQWVRLGVPNVYRPDATGGIPPNETTLAEYLKNEGYATGMIGKWHLGQRMPFLPGAKGFDEYLGIPFSADMGYGMLTPCAGDEETLCPEGSPDTCNPLIGTVNISESYPWMGDTVTDDWGAMYIPLIRQVDNVTTVDEQPVDFTLLGENYYDFTRDFIKRNADNPFLLYAAFSHVHTAPANFPGEQYAGCSFRGNAQRGPFGEGIAEMDYIVAGMMEQLETLDLMEDTMIIFSSDNGPWLAAEYASGSVGIFSGVDAGYWNTGKASSWEGGIRMPSFVSWRGKICPGQRISTTVSHLDIVPTVLDIAGASPPNEPDGYSFKDIILYGARETHHDFLFFYNTMPEYSGITSARWKQYKLHWRTSPGLNSCSGCETIMYPYDAPLVFDVEQDPAEMWPAILTDSELEIVAAAYLHENATMTWRDVYDLPGEGPYAVCCDRAPWGTGKAHCNCSLPGY